MAATGISQHSASLAQGRAASSKGDLSAGQQSSAVLLKALAERDPELGIHLGGVAELACATAVRLGVPDQDMEVVRQTALLHDVGKVAIPEEILGKPGPLDEAEWILMKRHTIIGQRIISAAPALADVAILVRSTHERFDGGGYPDGLKGNEIPLIARIVAVCDAFDAMVTKRAYRVARDRTAAILELRDSSGAQFDPLVVDAFVASVQAIGDSPPVGTSRPVDPPVGEQIRVAQVATPRFGLHAPDAVARDRDLAALARDHAADVSDSAMDLADAAYAKDLTTHTPTGAEMRGTEQRERADQHRTHNAEQRALAAQDRQGSADDRKQAAREREHALADREKFARQIAIAETDSLTGARARGAGLSELDREVDRCMRTDGTLVVAYIDVVGLKSVNDAEGHAAGDGLLKRVVAHMRERLRSYDSIIRLGGDEFLCVMPGMTLVDARHRFGSIADDLAAAPDASAISTGFAELTPHDTAPELIARADLELAHNRRSNDDARPHTAGLR